MNDIRKRLATLLLKKVDAASGDSATLQSRYKQFRVSLLVAITLIAMLPATAISVFGYFQYLVRLEKQELQHLSWHLEDSSAKLSALVNSSLQSGNGLPDAVTLQQVAGTNNPQTDSFIVDVKGQLQDPSTSFAPKEIQFPMDLLIPGDEQKTFAEKKPWGVGVTLYGITSLDHTPWFLILVKDGPMDKGEWMNFQLTLLVIFILCFSAGMFIIFQLVNILTSRIRESDANRMGLLSDAEHSNKLVSIGRLAAGVAHEINNPLAVIDQKAGLIEDLIDMSSEFPHKEKVDRSIVGIHDAVQRCKIITLRLLNFARKMDTRIEHIDLNDLLYEVICFLEKEAIHHQIQLDLQFDRELPQIESDRGQLQQIFLNILNNAIDAVVNDGVITICSSRVDEDRIMVSVKDTGSGMDPETLKHIFDPFFTTKETGKGTGLGLSITYSLVKRLRGDILAENNDNKGMCFTVTLPVRSQVVING